MDDVELYNCFRLREKVVQSGGLCLCPPSDNTLNNNNSDQKFKYCKSVELKENKSVCYWHVVVRTIAL